jgi:type IV secretory pathway TraG/TraD family ATPase VirD4
MTSVANRWPLDGGLLNFGAALHGRPLGVPWTIRHACEGTAIFGATGSGKSSGSGRTLALSMLRAGFGGLVLCAKPDEARTWARYAHEAGREGDLVFFSPESGESFNFLDYELRRPGRGTGITENVVSVLMQCAEVGGVAGRGKDEVWERAMRQLLRNAVDLCRLSGRELRMELVHRLALSGPELHELLDEARERVTTENDRGDLDAVGRYFTVEWANMAERTRSGVVMNLTAVCDPFLRGSLRDLFCRETTVTPEDAHQGSIIVVDLPVKTFNELGRYAAAIWKFLFQRAAERREIDQETRPLFLFADECQLFVTSTDAAFQSTARSARVATVFLTQNLPNLYAEMAGGGPAGKQRADALLGNLQTKIFHQNSDHETNKWIAETLTRAIRHRAGSSGGVSFDEKGQPKPQAGASRQEAWEYEVNPRELLALAKGGPEFDFVVTGLLFQGGRNFPNGCHWIETAFPQGDE